LRFNQVIVNTKKTIPLRVDIISVTEYRLGVSSIFAVMMQLLQYLIGILSPMS